MPVVLDLGEIHPIVDLLETNEEWDAACCLEGLHLRFDEQLVEISQRCKDKALRVQADIFDLCVFPEAKKKEIYLGLLEAGEIDPPNPVTYKFHPKDQATVEAEYQHELEFYQTKHQRLTDMPVLIEAERILRVAGAVKRKPKGTTYYIDFDNGNDTHDGSHTAETDTNADGPFATLQKFTGLAATPDVGIVRMGMTQAVSADLAFANDGLITAPITLRADYGDAWGDHTDISGTATVTVTLGSKTWTFSADISGQLSANDVVYISGDDNTLYAYEVESVVAEAVTMYLPYKGDNAGSGKTVIRMGTAGGSAYWPIWNTAAGNFEVNLDRDNYWKFQGLWFRGTDVNGVFEYDSVIWAEWRDCIFEGNGAADYGIRAPAFDWLTGVLDKCRSYNCAAGMYAGFSPVSRIVNHLFDGNNTANSWGIRHASCGIVYIYDSEFKNHILGDLYTNSSASLGGTVWCLRNCLLSSATEFDFFDDANSMAAKGYSEDHDQVEGINAQYSGLTQSTNTPILEKETTKVRTGGGDSSVKITPVADMSTNLILGRVELFNHAIQVADETAKTFDLRVIHDDRTDWTANPTAAELYLEVEYWAHNTNPVRHLKRSTGTVDILNAANDTDWFENDEITVSITTKQAGIVYIRAYYAKTLEGGKSNILYADVEVE